MKSSKRILWDVGLFLSVLLLAGAVTLGIWFFRDEGAYAVVYVDGVEAGRYALSEDTRVLIGEESGQYNVLVIRDGVAFMEAASCPDQICVRHRAVSYSGEVIVCLPGDVVVEIVGGEKSEVDF